MSNIIEDLAGGLVPLGLSDEERELFLFLVSQGCDRLIIQEVCKTLRKTKSDRNSII